MFFQRLEKSKQRAVNSHTIRVRELGEWVAYEMNDNNA